jgi:hypothetical protein
MSGRFFLPHSLESIFNYIHILRYYFLCTVNNVEKNLNRYDFLPTPERGVN